MLRKRLFDLVPDALRHVILTVVAQWVGLLSDVLLAWAVCSALDAVVGASDISTSHAVNLVRVLVLGVLALVAKALSTRAASREAFAASADVKRELRHRIYEKLLRLGPDYTKQVSTAEVVQLSVEGCEQLETYFGQYMPQLFYALVAPLTLFVAILALVPAAWPAALVLLVFVPLIPLVIMAVQKVAKRMLSSYWDEYTTLGDSFLENLQGLTTLKIYQADARRHEAMDEEAEHFRVITMKVLRMQLNSIIVMDIVALGGAAAGIGVALALLAGGAVDLFAALMVVLLSADFFRPMRTLGSYFHIAMNGMAASDKIFALLDLDEPMPSGTARPHSGDHLLMRHVSFSWDGARDAVHDVSLDVPLVGLTAIVGESGSGKSTVASLLAGLADDFEGKVLLGGRPITDFDRAALARYVTIVPTTSYLFAGSVRDNLLMGYAQASDEQMWQALDAVSLAGFLHTQQGLDTHLDERAANLSGGQRQRLALARALMHDSPVYVLDEATSNIDVESEEAIMAAVRAIARYKAVILISHRLANVTDADKVYVLDRGCLVGAGLHEELLDTCDVYRDLWDAQQALEHFEPQPATDADDTLVITSTPEEGTHEEE